MIRDICTRFCRKALLLLAVGVLVFSALPLDSQNNKGTGTNTASAVMQIRINIVPMVFSPAPKVAVASSGVTYNVPTHAARLSVREELRAVNAKDGLELKAGALVRVTTVVAE
jgi:hypothetical protein